MISIRRIYLWVLMLSFTFSYFLQYMATPAFQYMIILMCAGVLVSAYSLQVRKGSWNISLLLLAIWMLMIQFMREGSIGTIPTLLYRTVPGLVSFSLLSSIGYEAARNPRRKRTFIAGIATFTVLWFIVYVSSIAGQRVARNWGYANYVYMIFALFPFWFLVKNKLLRLVSVIIMTSAAILSLKRTAFILLCVYALIYIIYEYRHKKMRKRSLIVLLLILLLFLWILLFTDIVQEFIENYLYRFAKAEEDGMGGRLEIWAAGLQEWSSSNILTILFGSEYTYQGLSMHNDYMEMLITYGLVGLVLIAGVLRGFLREYKFVHIAEQTDLEIIVVFTLANFVVLMLVSHVVIYPYMMFLCIMPFGFCHGFMRGGYINR